jgi:hypothetical protein
MLGVPILSLESLFLNLAVRSNLNSTAYINTSIYHLPIFLVNQGPQFETRAQMRGKLVPL